MAVRFLAVPVDMAEANRLVVRWHRRQSRVGGYKLALAAVVRPSGACAGWRCSAGR